MGPNGQPLTERELLRPSFLRKSNPKARLCFDPNDEYVELEHAMKDKKNFPHRYHMVEVLLKGEEEDEDDREILENFVTKKSGLKMTTRKKVDKITKDTF